MIHNISGEKMDATAIGETSPTHNPLIHCNADVSVTSDGKCSSLAYRHYDKCSYHKIKELEAKLEDMTNVKNHAAAELEIDARKILELEKKLAEHLDFANQCNNLSSNFRKQLKASEERLKVAVRLAGYYVTHTEEMTKQMIAAFKFDGDQMQVMFNCLEKVRTDKEILKEASSGSDKESCPKHKTKLSSFSGGLFCDDCDNDASSSSTEALKKISEGV